MKQALSFAAVLLAVAIPVESSADDEVVWAGHQVVTGVKKIPLLGELETRTDTFVVARVKKVGDTISFIQSPCRSVFKEVAGVSTAIHSKKTGWMPTVEFSFLPIRKKGWYQAVPYTNGWGDEDLDSDDNPGVTVDVDSMLCSGQVYVTAHNEIQARGKFVGDSFEGIMKVNAKQTPLGAEKTCLRMVVSEQVSKLKGTFAYTEVSADATCESLLKKEWPVHARVKGE